MGNRNGVSTCLSKKKDNKEAISDNLSGSSGKYLLNPQAGSRNIIQDKSSDCRSNTLNNGGKVQARKQDSAGEIGHFDTTPQGITDKLNTSNMTHTHTFVSGTSIEKQCVKTEQMDNWDVNVNNPNLQHTKKGQSSAIKGSVCEFRTDLFHDKSTTDLNSLNAYDQTHSEMKERQNELLVTLDNRLENVKESEFPDIKRLAALLEELEDDFSVYNEVLGKIYTIMKLQITDKKDQMVAKLLINTNILNKMDTYLHSCNINSFMDLKSMDDHCKKVWPVIKKFLTIAWTLCDRNVNFCQYVIETKTFLFLLSELRSLSSVNYDATDIYLFSIKAVLGILHNISRHLPNSKWTLRNEGLVTILRTFLPSQVSMIRLKTLIILSYILSEAENEIINSDDDNFIFIFQVLSDALKSESHRSKKYGMSTSEILKGINNLAINDENKIRIVRNGALPLYETILAGDGFPDEKKVTIMTLWSLAFHHYNKRKMREMPGIMERLYELRQCEDEEICHAARGTFWELENTSKSAISKTFSSSAEKDPNQPHIMISYQWDSQPIMIKVKDRLRHAGYKVWMDVEHMTGSTLEAMALAVEKAAVVLVCMSQKYKDSPNCRTEAEYVYRLRKDFVPLRLQCEYTPDGWLGILVGTRLYFDMYSEETLDIQLPKLVKELRDRGRTSPSGDEIDVGSLIPKRMISREAVPLLHISDSNEVRNWDSENIFDWLISLGMEEIYECLCGMDGSLLLEMQKIQKTAPEFFYTMLRNDLKLTTVNLLKFSKGLRCLR